MKKIVTLALCAIALAAITAFAAQDQTQKPCCQKAAQAQAQDAQAVAQKPCDKCPEGKKQAAAAADCPRTKDCDHEGCAHSATKEKSQQKPCCDQKKTETN